MSSDTIKTALFNNSVTQSQDSSQTYLGTGWVTGNEVTGTNWSAGGPTLASSALDVYNGTGVQFVGNNISVASTTLSGAYGAVVYDSTVSDFILAVFAFGGSYSTTAGTFAITWATVNSLQTLWYLTLT